MSQPVVVTVVFTPAEGKRPELVAALSRAIPEVHEEQGCELYAIHDAPDGTVVMLEKWTSAELLDAHAAGEPVQRLDASIVGLVAEPPLVTRIAPLPVGDPRKGAL